MRKENNSIQKTLKEDVSSMKQKYSRFLVTGGAGFVGSHIVDRLLRSGSEVVVLDNLSTGQMDNLRHNMENRLFRFVKGDIREFRVVEEALKDVDAVFHEGALASIVDSIRDPILANDINVTGTLNLLKAASDSDVERFMFASTAAVYGESPTVVKREDDKLDPISPYGLSKLISENYARLFYKLYGLKTVSLRYFNIYGPRQRFDAQFAYGGVISIFVNRLLRNMPPTIYGDGEQTRDFVYISDIVQANILALENEKASGDVFNIGTGKRTSVNHIARVLKDIMNVKGLDNVYEKPRQGDAKHGSADISKAETILGYRPEVSLEEGLSELVTWYTGRNNSS